MSGSWPASVFGVDDLRAINPDVIVASLTGYGQTGPSAGYMAYGPAGGAFSGLYSANGYEGGLPAETGIAVGDPCTGITALWSIVSALVARRRNHEVARIDVAMVEAVGASVGEIWMEYLATGVSPAPRANRDAMWAPHGCYQAAGDDDWISIACTTEDAWRALAGVIGGSGLAEDERFATMALTEGQRGRARRDRVGLVHPGRTLGALPNTSSRRGSCSAVDSRRWSCGRTTPSSMLSTCWSDPNIPSPAAISCPVCLGA